jgi:hypothetical protein
LDHIQKSERINKIYQAAKTSNPWVEKLQAILQNLGYSFIVDKDANIQSFNE